jgi:hypothetical protein
MSKNQLVGTLKFLMKDQKLAVLASFMIMCPIRTMWDSQPVMISNTYFFVTPVATRKYSYLMDSRKASMMIDNRSNDESDFKDTMAVNATGKVMEAEKTDDFKDLYLEKHPYLHDFLLSPSSALMRMKVKSI